MRKEEEVEKRDITIKEICNNMANQLDENSDYIEGIASLLFSEIAKETEKGKKNLNSLDSKSIADKD